MRWRAKEVHVKELQDPLRRNDRLARMRKFMHLSFNASSTHMIFGKG
jgi:hypothetical protein